MRTDHVFGEPARMPPSPLYLHIILSNISANEHMLCILITCCSYNAVNTQHAILSCWAVYMLHTGPQSLMYDWSQIIFAAAQESQKLVHIHAHALLAYIPARIDMMFKQPMVTSAFSICTLITLKCFPSQATYCGQSASNSRCPYAHTHYLHIYTHQHLLFSCYALFTTQSSKLRVCVHIAVFFPDRKRWLREKNKH